MAERNKREANKKKKREEQEAAAAELKRKQGSRQSLDGVQLTKAEFAFATAGTGNKGGGGAGGDTDKAKAVRKQREAKDEVIIKEKTQDKIELEEPVSEPEEGSITDLEKDTAREDLKSRFDKGEITAEEFNIESGKITNAGRDDTPATQRNLAGGPVLLSSQPKGVQAYQNFLLDVAVTGGSATAIKTVGAIAKTTAKTVGKFMSTKLGKYVTGGVASVATYSGIMTWLASDNIIGSMSIYGRDLAEDVTFGKITPEEGEEAFREGLEFVNEGVKFIDTATVLNPLLWPFRNIIKTSADAALLGMEENFRRITGTRESFRGEEEGGEIQPDLEGQESL